jgi:superfamily II DNA or RNA helicase
MSLRDYQREALGALDKGWANGLQRLGVSLPTGVGKTHIMAGLTDQELDRPGRIMWVLHRDQLVDQSLAKLRATLPTTTSIGIVKGTRNETAAKVIVASVHSLRSPKRLATLPTDLGLAVVDEAHVSVSQTYRALYDQIGAFRPGGPRLAGFSATWSRSDSTGLGDVWQDVVYHKTIKWAIQHRHLVPVRGIHIGDGVELGGVKVSRATGDYSEADLERVVMLEEVRDRVVNAVLRHRGDRPGVLFAPTVTSAEYFGDALREAGLRVDGWYGGTGKGHRRIIDHSIRSGGLDLMTTCTAVAEGYDNPQLGLGVLVRPTQHEGLFVQMVGRLLRPWPGKRDALLLDCVGATENVKLRNAIDLSVTRENDAGDVVPVEQEETEPVGRDRKARIRRGDDVAVELFAGTPVQWLQSNVGVPFVSCGDRVVFIVEGPGGTWNVGDAENRVGVDGRPQGRWVAEGLAQADALDVASDHAENVGEHLSRRSAAWRQGKPSEKQLELAGSVGIVVTPDMSRGALSDQLSVVFTNRVLLPFARWSEAMRSA